MEEPHDERGWISGARIGIRPDSARGRTDSTRRSASRVLIADVPEAARIVRACLAKHAAVVSAESLDGALAEIRQGVDLVVTGVHFADSQMLDLVSRIKSDPELRDLPVICIRLTGSEREPSQPRRLLPVLDALGNVEYVDLLGLIDAIGSDEALAEFAERIRSRLAAIRRIRPRVS